MYLKVTSKITNNAFKSEKISSQMNETLSQIMACLFSFCEKNVGLLPILAFQSKKDDFFLLSHEKFLIEIIK